MNIEIENVCPNRREARAFKAGWGAVHWACIPYTYAFMFGFLIYGVIVSVLAEDILPPFLFSGFLIGTGLVWIFAGWLVQIASAREGKKAPVGALPWTWSIGPTEIVFTNGLQTNRCDWRAIKAVREEDDRFLFLVSPAYNPVLPKRLLSKEQLKNLRKLISDVTNSGDLGRGVD